MTTTTESITLDETIAFLASTDEELKRLQSKDTQEQELSSDLALAVVEIIGVVNTPRTSPFMLLPKIWKIYKRIKRGAHNVSGKFIARLLSAIGGVGFCIKVDYCRSKDKLRELFDFSDSPEGAAFFARGTETAMESEYADAIRKLNEIMNAIVEITKEAAEEAADAVIPVGFIFLSVKDGLDELCKCCKKCDGSGESDGNKCEECDGSGTLHAA